MTPSWRHSPSSTGPIDPRPPRTAVQGRAGVLPRFGVRDRPMFLLLRAVAPHTRRQTGRRREVVGWAGAPPKCSPDRAMRAPISRGTVSHQRRGSTSAGNCTHRAGSTFCCWSSPPAAAGCVARHRRCTRRPPRPTRRHSGPTIKRLTGPCGPAPTVAAVSRTISWRDTAGKSGCVTFHSRIYGLRFNNIRCHEEVAPWRSWVWPTRSASCGNPAYGRGTAAPGSDGSGCTYPPRWSSPIAPPSILRPRIC
jgi:hypothetical protein